MQFIRTRRSRTSRLAASGLAAVLLLAACGDDDDGGAAGTEADAATTEAAATTEGTEAATEATDAAATEPSEPNAETTVPDAAAGESRFTGTETFCTPAEGEPAEPPTDTDPGITSDAIQVTHARMMVEDLAEIGFAFDLGDQNDFAQTFVNIVNDVCGGINGRRLELQQVEVPVPGFAPDADAVYQQACIAITEEQQSVATWSNSGVGQPLGGCLTAQNDTMFLGTYDFSASDFEQSGGRLFSVSHSPVNILKYAARELAPDLEGKTIGVVYDDGDPNPAIVEEGLLQTLSELGLEPARVDVIPCPDGPPCTEGVIPSVQGMLADGVDAMFVLLDIVSLPGYLAELVTQGAQPGDIQFFATSFLAQDSELGAGKIIEFAGEPAGALYNGAILVGADLEGEHRLDTFEADPFTQLCNDLYVEHSPAGGGPFDPKAGDDQARFFDAVGGQCAFVRMLARAIEAAGPNPTRADIAAAFSTLGEVNLAGGNPGSFSEGKPTAPDAIVRDEFRYPCDIPVENPIGHCIMAVSDYLALPAG